MIELYWGNSQEPETYLFSQNSPNYASLAVSFSYTVNKDLDEDTVAF